MATPDPDELTAKRRKTVIRQGFAPLEARYCAETGGGIVIGERNWARREVKAFYFRPRAHGRYFQSKDASSNHRKIALPSLKDLLDQEKAAKVAPHDLEVGQIVANIWGATMQDVRFFKVSQIPHPRKVRLAPLEARMVSGDWMAGKKTAIDRPVAPEEGSVYMVDMSGGSPEIKFGTSIDRCRPWDGNPVSIYSD